MIAHSIIVLIAFLSCIFIPITFAQPIEKEKKRIEDDDSDVFFMRR